MKRKCLGSAGQLISMSPESVWQQCATDDSLVWKVGATMWTAGGHWGAAQETQEQVTSYKGL